MKKLIILILLIAGFSRANAQAPTLMALALGDTISTSSSLDTVSKVIPVSAGYSSMGIDVKFLKLSGTSIGKAYLYRSVSGVTGSYKVIDSAAAAFDNSSGAQWAQFAVSTPHGYLYQVQVRSVTGANSTQTAQVRVYYVLHRFNN